MKTTPFLLLQLTLLGSLALPASAQLFWNTNASHSWDANRWGTTSSGPYNTAWVPGSAVTFQTSGTTITAATTNVGGLQVNTNVVVTAVADTILTLNGGFIRGNGNLNFGTQTLAGSANRTTGSGILTLNGANTFTAFTISANTDGGRVTTYSLSALGSGTVTVNGTLDIRNPLTIGGLTGTTGTIRRSFGTGNSHLTVGTGDATASFGGVIENGTDTMSFAKIGSGTQTLTGINTYTGGTTINAGTLALGHATNTLSNSGAVTVDGSTAILSISANSDTVGAVSLRNGASITGTTGVLTGSSYAVESGSISANLGGTGALTKTTSGTVTLSGTNTYSGTTQVLEGTLTLAQPMISDFSTVEIATDATLNLDFVGTDIIGTLTFDGVPQATGTTYGATGSGAAVIDDARFSGTGIIQVGSISDPFSSWMASFTFEPGADLSKTGDADGDGLSNLLEFALDGDPSSAITSGKVVSKVDGDYFTLTLPLRTGATFTGSGPLSSAIIDEMIYLIEGTEDLSGFTAEVEEQSPALNAGLPALSSGDWEYRTFRLTTPVSGEPKGFLRVGVTSEP